MKKICEICKEQFDTNFPNRVTTCGIVCREDRAKIIRKEKYRLKKINKVYKKRVCEGCNGKFLEINGRKRWCSEKCSKYSVTAKREVRNKRLLKRYGISIIDYENMYEQQGGCCSICKDILFNSKRFAAVDHDHKTGKVRGLLCKFCNRGLGLFHDDTNLLKKAILYLNEKRD